MKKILCILFIALCCCGCQKENTFENSNQEPSDASTQEKKKDNTILCYKIDSNGGTDHMIIHDENDNILKETTTYSIKILDNNSANDVLKKLNEDCDKIETENIKAICYVSQSDNTLIQTIIYDNSDNHIKDKATDLVQIYKGSGYICN